MSAYMVSTSAPASETALRQLTVVYRPIASLVPDPRNARTHPRRQIDQIKASIGAFGFTNPILADPEGRLIAGHGRLLAAREMGLAEVPVIELVGLSETQKKALRLTGDQGGVIATSEGQVHPGPAGRVAKPLCLGFKLGKG